MQTITAKIPAMSISLKVVALICLLSFSVNPQDEDSKSADNIIEYYDLFNTSMRDSVACFRIPAIVTAPNGNLITAIISAFHNMKIIHVFFFIQIHEIIE